MTVSPRVSFIASALCSSVLALTLAAGASSAARANPSYLEAFEARYGSASSLTTDTLFAAGSSCYTCHNPNVFFGDWNCYRRDLIARLRDGRTIDEALADIEFFDSDNDGAINIAEILTPRYVPGEHQVGYNPGLVGDLGLDPCLSVPVNGQPGPTVPNTLRWETPPSRCNRADVAAVGGTTENPGRSDSQLTVDDVIVYVNTFSDGVGCPRPPFTVGPCSLADLADVGDTAAGPDGQLTVDDVIAFVNAFSDGC